MSLPLNQPWFLAIALGCTLQLACSPHVMDVRIYGSKLYSCPAERVLVTKLKERPSEYLIAHRQPENPRPEIAADPERLAVWRATRNDDARSWDHNDAFEISACGTTAVVFCLFARGLYCNDAETALLWQNRSP